jgi:predicted aminopeptidase
VKIRSALAGLLGAVLLISACSPLYVARAGWAQMKILKSRVPLTEVMTDPATDPATAGKLRFVWDARRFAVEELGFRNAGDSYTSLARLPSDTLALLLSAAHQDRLAFRTWWFPVTGRVPYRAYFSEGAAFRARDELQADGFDTHLRPTAAFSTLGWFADPVYSTMLRLDDAGLVETVLHELAHNHLFIPGRGRFNESWATFAGHAAAAEFFCTREGGGPDTVKCRRARDRWADARDVSSYLMRLEDDVRAVLARDDLPRDDRIAERNRIYEEARDRFRDQVQPTLRATTYAVFADEPLNNATLLSRTLYFHRLEDFHRLWQEEWEGDLAGLLAWIREEAPRREDPFEVLGG